MEPRTIWILNHYAGTATSPSTRHYDLARELVRKGHNVTIFAAGFHYQKLFEERLAPGETWKAEADNGVRFIWLRTFPYKRNDWRRAVNMLSYAVRAVQIGRSVPERPDVIIGSSVHPLAVVAAWILSRIKKTRFVFEVRDLWPQTLIDMGALNPRGLTAWGLRQIEKFLYRMAEKIITLLPYAHEYISGLGIPVEKVVWIPNGADMARYERIAPYDGGSDARPFTIMYLGAHGKANALDVILEAAEMLQADACRAKFVFVGDGPEKRRLIESATARKLHNVEFRDPVAKNVLFNIMGEADAFIFNLEDLPLFRYGISSNKLFDYLASGRPVVFSGNTANNPVRESGAGISVAARSPRAIAAAVVELLRLTPAERVAMGEKGLAYMWQKHDIRMLANTFEQVIAPAA